MLGALKSKFEPEVVSALEKKLEMLPACPLNGEQIGDEWSPFAEYMDPSVAWRAYLDFKQIRRLTLSVTEFEIKNIKQIFTDGHWERALCAYEGIVAGNIMWNSYNIENKNFIAIILLKKDCRPRMMVSRSEVLELPLKVITVIYGITEKYHIITSEHISVTGAAIAIRDISLKEWRKVRETLIGSWVEEILNDFFNRRKQELEGPADYEIYNEYFEHPYISEDQFVFAYTYFLAQLQDDWEMTVNYEQGQIISFYEKKAEKRMELDLFPPMLFCKAASNQSRQYVCADVYPWRRVFTSDHPFIVWLLDNAFILDKYYNRQF